MDYSDIYRVIERIKNFYMKKFCANSYKIAVVTHNKKTRPDENLDQECMIIFSAGEENCEDVLGNWTFRHSKEDVIKILSNDSVMASMVI